MNQDKWQKAKELFHEAQALPLDERVAFLDKACGGDLEVREQVENLLGSYESGFMEEPVLNDVIEAVGAGNEFNEGQVIGRYQLKELIGSGGMGEVFRADDTELNRPVAFKVLHAEVAEDKDRIRRFIQEARAASALNHPNILTIHEIGKSENSRFIVSEYVQGETLRERLNKRPPTIAESVEIAEQIAAALQAAHEAGIVHRDIKPENIMLRKDGFVKVLDFGLAKLSEPQALAGGKNAGSESANLTTAPGIIMGTVAYMSPEQARGLAVDARTDIWSLGVVLYEMLSGKLPFPGDTTSDMIASILKSDAEPLDKLGTTIPRGLESICLKALAKNANQRFQTAQDLLNELRGATKKMENILAPSALGYINEQNTEIIRHRPTLSAEYIVQGVRRHKLATFAAALLITLVGIGFSVYKFNGAPPPTGGDDAIVPVIAPSTTETDLKMSRFPSTGKVAEVAISPDGKYIAYVTTDGSGKNGLRLRQLATSKDVEVVPAPTIGRLMDLSFSPDANQIYYLHNTPNNEEIYRVSILGGQPTKIANDTDGGGSISPDGKLIAFNREVNKNVDGEDLVVANADGSNERVLVHTGPEPDSEIFCGGVPAWSPDGKSIACRLSFEDAEGDYLRVFGFSTVDGSRRQLSDRKWSEFTGAAYMPDGSLVIAAKERSAEQLSPSQLWLITANGEAKPITNDLVGYSTLSVTRKGDLMVTVQSRTLADIWSLTGNDVKRARPITTSGELVGGFSWTPNGKFLFSSGVSGNADIWIMNDDGSERKQLTSNHGANTNPSMTADGRYIVFSNRINFFDNHVFRMDADGKNLKQLTNGLREWDPRISPDGKWVYYVQVHADNDRPQEVRRVSIDGGEPVILATTVRNARSGIQAVSPKDGRIVYQYGPPSGPRTVNIISPTGSPSANKLELPTTARGPLRFTPDGRSIAFYDYANGLNALKTIPATGKARAKSLLVFSSPMGNFEWSRDGKQFAYIKGTSTSDAILITNKGN